MVKALARRARICYHKQVDKDLCSKHMIESNKAPVREGQHIAKVSRGISFKAAAVVMVLVAVSSFVMGARGSEWLATATSADQNQKLPPSLNYAELDAVYDVLRSNYAGDLSAQDLLNGAKEGLVKATGDPYSEFFTAEEAEKFFSSLDGEFSGIGAELGMRDDRLTVISTLDGTPARQSGLKAGDAIIQVNDQSTQDWSITKAVTNIRGKKGTTVKLTVLRGGEVKTFNITRADIENPSVRSEIIAGNIGVISISRFSDKDTVELAREAAQRFKQQGVQGVILDLRGNGGGYVQAAQGVAGIWIEGGKVIVEERADGETIETLRAQGEPILDDMPTAVLINGASASASEIVAGALKDYGIATLVGQTSFGKGSVQQIVAVPGGGQLKVTVAKWFTPNGNNINGEGITPSVKVKLTEEDVNAGRDPQRAKAVEILKR